MFQDPRDINEIYHKNLYNELYYLIGFVLLRNVPLWINVVPTFNLKTISCHLLRMLQRGTLFLNNYFIQIFLFK